MSSKLRILSYLFIALFCFKSALFSITSYLYVNENETLTELCCINKNTDTSCKAKCFLESTKQTSKDTEKSSVKLTVDYFTSETNLVPIVVSDFKLRIDNFCHLGSRSISSVFLLDRPPSI